MANLKDCSTCANVCEICSQCVNYDKYVPKEATLKNDNHDQYIPKKVMCKNDCKYFGLRTIDKPCSYCKNLCMYSPADILFSHTYSGTLKVGLPDTNNTNKKKYGVGELPYLGGSLNWVHLFETQEDAEAYYGLVKLSCTKSKLNVHIIKFVVDDEIKLKDGNKDED